MVAFKHLLKETAVLKKKVGLSEYGKEIYTEVAIKCRKEDRTQFSVVNNAEKLLCNSIYYTTFIDIHIGDLINEARVVKINGLKDIRGKHFGLEVYVK